MMTKQTEAMKLALEALREFVQTMGALPASDETSPRVRDAYYTACAAIAKGEQP